jgi:hypothetical protein
MPLKAIDYSKTIIYKIVCKDLSITDVYVGHTTGFKDRKSQHKINCYNENNQAYNFKVYKYIRDNGNWENFDMIQIEEYPCNNVREAQSRERYWYELLNANLNMNIPFRSDEDIKEYNKKYYDENKEELKELNKKYKEEHKEQIKEQKKKYREENKEELKELNKKWIEKNKECIREYSKEYSKEWRNKEYICSCGWVGNNSSKRTHLKKCNQKIEV